MKDRYLRDAIRRALDSIKWFNTPEICKYMDHYSSQCSFGLISEVGSDIAGVYHSTWLKTVGFLWEVKIVKGNEDVCGLWIGLLWPGQYLECGDTYVITRGNYLPNMKNDSFWDTLKGIFCEEKKQRINPKCSSIDFQNKPTIINYWKLTVPFT